jgi:hypothetical protein
MIRQEPLRIEPKLIDRSSASVDCQVGECLRSWIVESLPVASRSVNYGVEVISPIEGRRIIAKGVYVDSTLVSVGHTNVLPEVSFWMFYVNVRRPSGNRECRYMGETGFQPVNFCGRWFPTPMAVDVMHHSGGDDGH